MKRTNPLVLITVIFAGVVEERFGMPLGITYLKRLIGLVALVGLTQAWAATPPDVVTEMSAAQLKFFESDIRPVLIEHCYGCHSAEADRVRGSLLLDSRTGWKVGGDSGQVILPGDAEASLLVRMIEHDPDVEPMPPKSKLSPEAIASIKRWINEGALDPRDQPLVKDARGDAFDLEQRKKWWAFQPIQRFEQPAVSDQAWPKQASDYFILSALETKGWKPAPRASKEQLLRRLSFDLIGLAPTRQEVEAFIQDTSSEAYAKQVDRLLASPHFGEKWARHWMDVVRYGETKAFEFDYTMPYAHRYRDYLIRAFNQDVPYDQFVLESFAGDLLETPRYGPDGQRNESLHGPGFLFLTVGQHGPPDIHEDEARVFSDVIDTASKAYLGITVACARCHDHKFDAITAGDYYAWYGMLRSSRIDIANSVPVSKQLQGESMLAQLEPELRRESLSDVSKDVERVNGYMQAAKRFQETDVYQKAWGAYRDLIAKQKEATWKERQSIDPVGAFKKACEKWVQSEAQQQGLDAVVLQAWIDYVFIPEVRKAWPQLEPLYRALVPRVKDHDVAKTLKPIKPVYPVALEQWLRSGPAFANRQKSEGPQYRHSTKDPKRVLHGIADRQALMAGVYSGRVTGAIRSPDFVLDGSPVELYARGKGATIRLIVRNYELAGRGPTTGVLSVSIDQASWKQVTIKTDLWAGQPAYLEVVHGGQATKALMPHQTITPVSDDAYVELRFDNSPDWQTVWKDAVPVDVIAGLVRGAQQADLGQAQVDVLDALLNVGLIRAGADRNPALKDLVAAYQQAVEQIPEPHYVRTLTDGTAQDVPVYIRGNHKNLSKDPNPRRFLDAFDGVELEQDSSGRLDFSRQMIDESNPLLPRVMVNRLWHYLFGRGIVASVDDFGKLGSMPSHPELLDDLASRFVENGWSMKSMIREMVLSSTYQMSTLPGEVAGEQDPDNVFLQRMPVKRLDAEQVRDHILWCSGELDAKMYGPSVGAYVDDLPYARGKPKSGPANGEGRRSVYMEIRRNFLPSFLSIFGMPNATEATGRRNLTNVPSQSLALMNSPFVHEQAGVWAERLAQSGLNAAERIAQIHFSAFGREPTPEEIAWSKRLLDDLTRHKSQQTDDEPHGMQWSQSAWRDFCHVILNRKEFIYLF